MYPKDLQKKLCYVKEGFAYFSSKKPIDVSGDDWDDVPYEHNAGEPYCKNIVIAAFKGLSEPYQDGYHNSPWSVDDINELATPWLRNESISLFAGTTLEQFIALAKSNKYRVFVEADYGRKDKH